LEGVFSQEERTFSPDVIIIFVSLDPDKRFKLFKILSEKANIKTFPNLNDAQITGFIQQKLGNHYSAPVADYLISYVGSDLFRIEQECDKISSYLQYTKQDKLTEQDMEAIIYTPIQANAFAVLDALAT
jgi:DNA polymerase III delta subunit